MYGYTMLGNQIIYEFYKDKYCFYRWSSQQYNY